MKKIIIGLALMFFGFLIPCAMVIPLIFAQDQSLTFSGPGSIAIQVDAPKKYYLWNTYKGTSGGKTFSSGEIFPAAAAVKLTEKESGEFIPFQPDSSISTFNGDRAKKSIGYFTISSAGPYILTISDLTQERLFSWSPSPFEKMAGWIGTIIFTGLITLLFMVGSLVLIIIGMVELSQKSNPSTPAV